VDVDRINEARLAELDEPEQRYQMMSTGAENYVESLKRSCLAQEVLTLKKGALVMTVKNSPDKKYVNGSLGIVIGFEPMTNYPIVEFKANGRQHAILPESWELRDGDKKRAGLSQIPLRLAWAITVHKSQGMTLDAATIDLRRAFVEGMGYVALSRVRRLESLSLLGLNRMALRISDDAFHIDESLRTRAEADAKRFAHLKKKAEKHFTEKPKEKKESGWAEKIAKMRETYPNAYRPWTDSDDADLKQQFLLGDTVKKMSGQLGRHERSIIMRLQKHFGEDIAL
jgi:ATP-dependent exoDNAse (exonuclease V) alpha subunit